MRPKPDAPIAPSHMTLKLRLLLVYFIVVLLSGATVGTAVFELKHAHRIIRELQDWYGITLHVEQLKTRWPPPEGWDPLEYDLKQDLAEQFRFLAEAPAYLDKDRVIEALRGVYRSYDEWRELPGSQRLAETDIVQQALKWLSDVLQSELYTLDSQAASQVARTQILLVVVAGLTLFHVMIIGTLLRRWLLWPMERLNRQVDALARDEPPSEPLLTSPREMANLATALDRARVSLRALRQQLIDAERLTTIGEFAAQLAHNLRNPLASIRAVAQLTSRQASADDALKTRMDDVIVSVDRLNRWVAGLMEVARREPSATQSGDVVPMVRRVVEGLAGDFANKELAVTLDLPEQDLTCLHDPPTLEHALIALVVNAIEASPLGGKLRITVRPGRRDGTEVCCIEVADQGQGLPADDPERIFEFSYSTKQRGMGLGLSLGRQALQRQGGSIHARNNSQGGATVWVELPIARGIASTEAETITHAEDSDR